MRVLQVLEATLGGTRRYLQDIARASLAQGYTNGLAYSLVRADSAFHELLRDLQAAGWEMFEIDMRRAVGFSDARAVAQLRSAVRNFAPDVLHSHSSKAGALSRLACIGLAGGPAIAYSPNAIASNLSRAYDLAERALAPMLDALIAVGPSERRELERLNIVASDRISIVVPTVDEAYYTPGNRNDARRNLTYGDEPLVAAVGRLTPQKDPLGFVHFMRELRTLLPSARGLWVGDGELRSNFEEALRSADLSKAVTITGWVDDVRPFFAAADLFVSVSAYESFGYVTAEAFASDRPVVASAITGTIDIVTTDIERQLFAPSDFKRAARLANDLLIDRELASLVAARGRAAVLEAFSPDCTREQLARAYTAALDRKNKRSSFAAQFADRMK